MTTTTTPTTEPAVTVEPAAERVHVGRERLGELTEQLKAARAAEAAITDQQKALDDAVRERERVVAEAQTAAAEASAALVRLHAAELLSMHVLDPLERKQCESALTRAQQRVEEAKEQQRASERIRAAERPLLESKVAQAAAKATDLEQLREAVHAAIAEAHEESGQDRLIELQDRHAALLGQRTDALATYKAASAALRGFYGGLPDELSAWPELARRTRNEQVGHGLTPAREIVEAFLLYLDALQVNAGVRMPGYNDASLPNLLAWLDGDVVRDLLGTSGQFRAGQLNQMRLHAARVLERLG